MTPKKWLTLDLSGLIVYAKKTYGYSDSQATNYANAVLRYRK